MSDKWHLLIDRTDALLVVAASQAAWSEGQQYPASLIVRIHTQWPDIVPEALLEDARK